jgi:hypothetical protein
MFLIDVDELRRQKDSYNYDFERRMAVFEGGVGTKLRRTKHPQQQYACSCTTMRTYRGDILSSTCRDCKANGTAILDCRTCKCNCQTGIFTEKDVQAMAIEKAQKDEIKARQLAPETERRTLINFGALLSSSVKNGIENLRRSNSLSTRQTFSPPLQVICRGFRCRARKSCIPSSRSLRSLRSFVLREVMLGRF